MSRDDLELDKLGGYKETKQVYNKEKGEYEEKVVQIRNKETGKLEDKVIKRRTALFVIISDTDASFNFIVSLMYSQLFNILCDKADGEFRGRLPVHVRCLLESSCRYGHAFQTTPTNLYIIPTS